MSIKIVLTKAQQTWLLKFLNREWDEEVEYQWRNQQSDTSYLKDMLDVYRALLGLTNSFITAMVNADDIESKQKQIDALEESNN